MNTERDLALRGWKKQCTCDEPRLSELAHLYREIGYNVRLEPFDPDAEPGCAQCMKIAPESYKTVYTRRKPSVNSDNGL